MKKENNEFFEKIEKKIELTGTSFPENVKKSLEKMDIGYDQRIVIFKNLLKHRKKLGKKVYMKDLYHWFPECYNHDIYDLSPIPEYIILNGLEVFIAELLDHNLV